jgi:8-oxo-dGTP pyrophosphatase MutT (NUDIX family)
VAGENEDEVEATGSTVTFELRCGDKFLLVKRSDKDKHFAGHWAFPGGRVRAGESLIRAAVRECGEEVGIELTGALFFVDSYPLENTTRTGVHIVLEAADDVTHITEFPDHRWVSSVAEMSELEPRIAGIDNHADASAKRLRHAEALAGAVDRLEYLQAQAGASGADLEIAALRAALRQLTWSTVDEADLVRPKYLNQ